MNVNLFKGTVIANGFTIKDMAKEIGIDEVTLYRKLNGKSDFYCGEIVKICKMLNIADPNPIFFADKLAKTQVDT